MYFFIDIKPVEASVRYAYLACRVATNQTRRFLRKGDRLGLVGCAHDKLKHIGRTLRFAVLIGAVVDFFDTQLPFKLWPDSSNPFAVPVAFAFNVLHFKQ
jgi:hypothetical protein